MQFWEIKMSPGSLAIHTVLPDLVLLIAVIALFRVPAIFCASRHFTGTSCTRPRIFPVIYRWTGVDRDETDRMRSALKS